MNNKKSVLKKPTDMKVGDYFRYKDGLCVVRKKDVTFLHDHPYASVVRLRIGYDGGYVVRKDSITFYEHESYKFVVEGNIKS